MKLIATTTGAIRSFRFTKSDELSLSLTLFSLFLITVLHAQTTVKLPVVIIKPAVQNKLRLSFQPFTYIGWRS